jgi:hypothetical protein
LSSESEGLLQSGGLGLGDFAARVGQAVISTTLIIIFGVRPFIEFDNESLIEQTPDGCVQRPGIQLQAATGAGSDILHDRVSVPVPIRESHKDVERCRRQGQ